jgi:DnaD/phage-associated family protein
MKDPAFLFYSSDFLSGTMLMTDEEIGQYIKLLCLQHQKGHLKEKDMLNICKTYNEDIFSKFTKDADGNYYNERLEYEANKRKAYSESRRNNRKKKEEKQTCEEDMKNICNSYEKHMGNRNRNENININKNILYNEDVEKINQTFLETIGSTNINNIKECIEYLDKLEYEVIEYALKQTARVGAKWNYTKAILDNYVSENINTLEKVTTKEIEFKNKNKKQIEEHKETKEETIARWKKEWGLTDED